MPEPVEFATRLLFPFRFGFSGEEERSNKKFDPDILSLFDEHTLDPRCKGKPVPVWERVADLEDEDARNVDKGGLYPEEMLPQVAAFFFRPSGQRSGRYFRLTSQCRDRILNGEFRLWPEGREAGLAELEKPESERRQSKLPLRIQEVSGAELFVTGFGIGVLSVIIRGSQEKESFSCLDLRELLYRITQKRGFRAPSLTRSHPADDRDRWLGLSDEQRKTIEENNSCSTDAPLEERLGSAGAELKLVELCRTLIGPISEPDPAARTRYRIPVYDDAYQRQLAHYTVVRFDSSVEFGTNHPHPELIHELSGLTQLEERHHAGVIGGEISVPWKVLNRKHLVAAGSQGSVHFVANQTEPPSGFDHNRVRLILDKYFMDFLLVYLQDHYLSLATRQCGELVEPVAEKPEELVLSDFPRLRSDILAFDSLCFVSKISQRDAHNRYYRLAMQALGVSRTFEDVATQLEDLDAVCKFEIQEATRGKMIDLAKAQNDLVGVQNKTQEKLEWVEIFVVAAYSVYLINYIGKNFEFAHEYVGWWIVGGSAAAAGLTAWLLRPWSHAPAPAKGFLGKAAAFSRKWYSVLAVVTILATSYIGIGKLCFTGHGGEEHPPHSAPTKEGSH